MRTGPSTRFSDDRGFAGGAEVLPFVVLVFVVGSLLITNTWAVVDARWAVDTAAREAGRRYVEADLGDPAGPPEALAVEAGIRALEAHGRDGSRGSVALVSLDGATAETSEAGGFSRCARATFEASYSVPGLSLPWIGGFGDGFRVTSRHSEIVDPYRDGVPGEAGAC